jgi:hypothetical protein
VAENATSGVSHSLRGGFARRPPGRIAPYAPKAARKSTGENHQLETRLGASDAEFGQGIENLSLASRMIACIVSTKRKPPSARKRGKRPRLGIVQHAVDHPVQPPILSGSQADRGHGPGENPIPAHVPRPPF